MIYLLPILQCIICFIQQFWGSFRAMSKQQPWYDYDKAESWKQVVTCLQSMDATQLNLLKVLLPCYYLFPRVTAAVSNH